MPEEEKELLGTSIGNYVVESFIGAGGMGSVYLGVHPEIGKKVAIKILASELSDNPQMSERFIFEAKAVNQIEHPNIVEIYDFGRLEDNRLYYTMEMLKGKPLDDLMKEKMFSISEATHILKQIASALDAVHKHGIVHRDLKPENIFINNKGGIETAKLLDFGIAKLLDKDNTAGFKTATGVIMGTPYYMSPEQAKGEMDRISPRSDMYSLGVILYQMVSGELPISGQSMGAILVNQITQTPTPLTELIPGFPPSLWESLSKTLEKEPEDRYETVGEFAASFIEASGVVPPTTVYGINRADIDRSTNSVSPSLSGTFSRSNPSVSKSSISGAVMEELPKKSRLPIIVLSVIILLGVVAGAYFAFFSSKKEGEDYKDQSTPKVAVKPAVKPMTSPKPMESPKIAHLTVKSKVQNVKVMVKIAGKPDFFYETPFTLNLSPGEKVILKTQKEKYKELIKSITVTKDEIIDLKIEPEKVSKKQYHRRRHTRRKPVMTVVIKPVTPKPMPVMKKKPKKDSDSTLKIY